MQNTQLRPPHRQTSGRTGTGPSILTIAALEEFRAAVGGLLEAEGYQVTEAATGSDGLEVALNISPDVVILDSKLPDMALGELCLRLRGVTTARIVALTDNQRDDERLVALAAGADESLNKPFTTTQLLARLKASDRDQHDSVENPQFLGQLRIDRLGREVHSGTVEIHLTRIEFDLLSTLAARPDMVFTREMLLQQVWHTEWSGDAHVLSVHMANLRRKIDLGEGASQIKTVRGVGYRFAG